MRKIKLAPFAKAQYYALIKEHNYSESDALNLINTKGYNAADKITNCDKKMQQILSIFEHNFYQDEFKVNRDYMYALNEMYYFQMGDRIFFYTFSEEELYEKVINSVNDYYEITTSKLANDLSYNSFCEIAVYLSFIFLSFGFPLGEYQDEFNLSQSFLKIYDQKYPGRRNSKTTRELSEEKRKNEALSLEAKRKEKQKKITMASEVSYTRLAELGFSCEKTKNGAAITNYNGKDDFVVIPGTVYGHYEITELNGVSEGYRELEEIYISSNVKHITNEAFKMAFNLKKISFPGRYFLQSLGKNCFASASSLFKEYENVRYLKLDKDDYLVAVEMLDKTKTEVRIHPNCAVIAEEAFADSNIRSINLENISGISKNAFKGCQNLTNVSLKNLTYLGVGTFANCKNLRSITLPLGITELESETFMGCVMLSDVSLPNNIKKIGDNVFLSCNKLTSISIPNDCRYIGKNAFLGCDLTSVKYNGFWEWKANVSNGLIPRLTYVEIADPKEVAAFFKKHSKYTIETY